MLFSFANLIIVNLHYVDQSIPHCLAPFTSISKRFFPFRTLFSLKEFSFINDSGACCCRKNYLFTWKNKIFSFLSSYGRCWLMMMMMAETLVFPVEPNFGPLKYMFLSFWQCSDFYFCFLFSSGRQHVAQLIHVISERNRLKLQLFLFPSCHQQSPIVSETQNDDFSVVPTTTIRRGIIESPKHEEQSPQNNTNITN